MFKFYIVVPDIDQGGQVTTVKRYRDATTALDQAKVLSARMPGTRYYVCEAQAVAMTEPSTPQLHMLSDMIPVNVRA